MDFLTDPVGTIAKLLLDTLVGIGLPQPVGQLLLMVIGVVLLASFALVLPLFLILWERWMVARMQDRVGPNRVGPGGWLQTVADMLKLLTKEDITPDGADKISYNIAPMLAVISIITMWAVIPFAKNIVGTDVNIGVMYIVSVGSLGTLAIMMAGWSSNNKYALLGAFRTVAQLVSYEVPMILSLIVPVMLAGSMGMNDIVNKQNTEGWYIFLAPMAALVFFITSIAEVGRAPFDLLEAESEIVAGFHIEYSGMKFAMFFAAEFMHAFTIGALTAVLFFGGWSGPGADAFPLLGVVYFMLKSFALYFTVIWVRATMPRIRIDHMHDFNWKFLVPFILIVIVVTALVDKSAALVFGMTYAGWPRLGILFLANMVMGWLTLVYISRRADAERKAAGVDPKHEAPPPHEHDTHDGHDAYPAPAH